MKRIFTNFDGHKNLPPTILSSQVPKLFVLKLFLAHKKTCKNISSHHANLFII